MNPGCGEARDRGNRPRAGAAVVPVFHWGAEQILPRDTRRFRWARLRVRFGPALRFSEDGRGDRDALDGFSHQLMLAIAALQPARMSPDCVVR